MSFKEAPQDVRLRLPNLAEILDDRYRIDRKVAGGTYGIVYEGTDLHANQTVAVKCLLPSAATRMAVVRRFEREIQVIRELTHPNVISIIDYGLTSDGCLYYVMDYLEGVDLGTRLRSGPLPFKGTALVAIQVLLALEEAHRRAIIHRDLKPENIFLQTSADGRIRVRVLDFGIAKVIGERGEGMERLTLQNEACGTPNYMAPEQITGDAIGSWTDIYALGLITYEMLTGQMAVQGASYVDTLRIQTMQPIHLPEAHRDSPLAPVIARSLEKKSKDRYADAAEMRDAFIRAVSGT